MREVVLHRLEAIPGIVMRSTLSKDESFIICGVRASRSLLFSQAERCQTKLAMWPEVDPGDEYWRDTMNQSKNAYIWRKEDAQNEL